MARPQRWDQFAIPRPYSRARAIPSGEIFVPPDLDRDGLEHFRQRIEALLNRLTAEAEPWAASGWRKLGAATPSERQRSAASAATSPFESPLPCDTICPTPVAESRRLTVAWVRADMAHEQDLPARP